MARSPDAAALGDHRRAGPGDAPELGAILGEAWSTFAIAWPACLVVYWGAVAAAWLILACS